MSAPPLRRGWEDGSKKAVADARAIAGTSLLLIGMVHGVGRFETLSASVKSSRVKSDEFGSFRSKHILVLKSRGRVSGNFGVCPSAHQALGKRHRSYSVARAT